MENKKREDGDDSGAEGKKEFVMLEAEKQDNGMACGPGCNCGAPSSGNRAKLAIFLVILVAAAGIIAYKVFSNSNNSVAKAGSAFAVAQTTPDAMSSVEAKASSVVNQKMAEQSAVPETKPTETNNTTSAMPGVVDKPSSVTPQNMSKKSAVPEEKPIAKSSMSPEQAKGGQKIGEDLESLSDLNKVAMNQDAVFVFIPDQNSDLADDKTTAAVLAAQRNLNRNNITLGLYTLSTSSPNYPMISAQAKPPAVLVAIKGKGIGAVSGEVTETKLLQAFMAASRVGSCSPSGCGPSAKGCK